MKALGYFLAISSAAVMLFGMKIVKQINFDNVMQYLENKTSYTYINERVASDLIFTWGPAVLLIGVFCIALSYSLNKK